MSKRFEFKSNGKFNVEVTPESVSIEIRGIMNYLNKGGSKGNKIIAIRDISAIQFKKPRITTGYVQFAYNGSIETKGGSNAAVKDENSITFTQKELAQAEEMVALIEKYRSNRSVGNGATSTADEIKKYKELYDEGILTKEEFQKKKAELLNV